MSICVRTASLVASLLVAFATCTPMAAQSTIHVPADQPTIQAAIDAAAPGDTVLVAPGTYTENISFKGKAITVASDSGPQSTIIDGNAAGPVVVFATGEGPSSVLQGFTIRNGVAASGQAGGGISIQGASPTIRNNTINANRGCGGAGIGLTGGSPVIDGNTVSNGKMSLSGGCTGADGGGIVLSGAGTPTVSRNYIDKNVANVGGGIAILDGSAASLSQNLVASNSATQGGGIFLQPGASATPSLIANTFANNDAISGAAVYADPLDSATLTGNIFSSSKNLDAVYCASGSSGALASFTYNLVFSSGGSAFSGACDDQTGSNHNISADPLLSNITYGDFHLSIGSPAIDAGNNAAVSSLSTDYDGNTRVVNGAGSATVDIGALEYQGDTTFTVDSTALSFPDTAVGVNSSSQTLVVVNTGAHTLYLKPIAMPTDYTEGNNCSGPLGVAPGAGCAIDVTFSPLSGGQHDETMTILGSNVPGAGANVAVSGKALAPIPTFSTTSLAFADQTVLTDSAPQTVTLTNTGNADLVITQVSSTTDYKVTHNCATLAPTAQCTFSVVFSPVFVGPRPGRISIFVQGVTTPLQIELSGNGIGPSLLVSNSSLTFPTIAAGSTSDSQSLVLTSNGTDALNIRSITVQGDFSQTNDCPSTLAPATTCTVKVTFVPTQLGARTGKVVIDNSGSSTATEVFLLGTGTATAPTITQLSPSSVTMGSGPITLEVTGSYFVDGAQIVFGGVARTTTYTSSTKVSASIPASDLATAGTVAVSVVNPVLNGTGAASAVLPFTIAPQLALSPQSLVFAAQLVGKTGDSKPVTVTNNTTGPISISSISVSGDFSETTDCAASVAAGASCAISVTMKPSTTGQLSGTLTVNSSAAGAAQTVSLAGYGASMPVAAVAPASLNFSSQVVGSTSAAQVVGIVNGGTEPLNISSIAVTGPFVQTNTCTSALAPDAHCGIAVAFAPTASGNATGTVTITHNAATSPTVITLSGSGSDFGLSSGSGPTSASVSAGGSATYNLSVSGTSGFSGTVSFSCSGAPQLSTCTISPPTVNLSNSTSVPVTVTVATTSAAGGFVSSSPVLPRSPFSIPTAALLACLSVAFGFIVKQRRPRLVPGFVLIIACAVLTSCGGNTITVVPPKPQTAAGTYTVVVTATSASVARTMNLTLTVK